MNEFLAKNLSNSLIMEDMCRRLFLFEFNQENLEEILDISTNLSEPQINHPFISELKKAKKDSKYLNEARWEFNRLFVGPTRPKAVPYESVYFDYHTMFGEKTMQVREFYTKAGIKIKDDKFPDDFIGFEFEYLYFMSYKAINSSNDEIIKEKSDFLHSHPLNWFDQFTKLCIDESRLEIWREFAKFVRLYLENEIKILNKILKRS
ncbi:ubiquinol cytochrome C oxidoreductase, Rieske 2Fe-2S subunit [Campylobacter sputorum subsp. bubulus]|uniref:Ubiquinol cytochrome C oxidoreductase, Rieske 2Fe-2S subunit n=1 Tax=Campylobacter sputorum subsp. sputorum TaxID=32024 RepID=A0A381DH44_9BACT|nr:molecular chaperone TorD family protein [Campylobacter sputorum]ASM35064.1 reductase assembly protein [Campylobacter sputorum aubsp. sputorum RM3237]KAB0581333.1 molecular chaperone TorD family protein [Campylobacter sputorum subsp. sputorum]QEL05254.1 reductase assembly protein [Campylobacter sputorum subsp. sputorum]SUX08946.1 ubiquinol cytochrome C oxidoreductase, Rieske 2Fe-2S subunit [Campylobacter sputorum subsp. bubulus]SUX09748.1 ubiquinol cytochrome C oxidoreductase, Rieske 2Fe-2S 